MVSISETDIENQSKQVQLNLNKSQQQKQQEEIQKELIKSIQLYHSQQQQQQQQQQEQQEEKDNNNIMSTKSSEPTTTTTISTDGGSVIDDITKDKLNKNTEMESTTTKKPPLKQIGKVGSGENKEIIITKQKLTSTTTTTTTTTITTPTPKPKSAVSQRSIEIEIDKTATQKPRNLRLDLVTTKSEEQHTIKSPKTPKTPKSPLSTTGRLSHQTSLSSQIDDVVEDRKTLRDALYQGIFHRHRKTIFAMGSFLRMLRSRNSQYNTIRSSSEGEDIDDAR